MISGSSRQVHFDRGVLDIAKSGSELWVLRSAWKMGREVAVSLWRKEGFEDLAWFEAPINDDPVALLNDAETPIVLSRRAIRAFSAGEHKFTAIELKGELRSGVQISTGIPAGGDSVYVGFNAGE